jgi:transcriptional regulator with XRE-family HTH domain
MPTTLGAFLRARREALPPEAIGLPATRRRTPGLRREDVANRAGIGVDWYIRLEQGRATSPSAATLAAISRALTLTPAEHATLLALAEDTAIPLITREILPDGLRRMVERLDHPAYITGRRWDILAWNDAANALFTDFGRMPRPDRNLLVFMFTTAQSRRAFGLSWAVEARAMLGQFRTTQKFRADDPAFRALLDRIGDSTPEFPAWWQAAGGAQATAGLAQKILFHPAQGPVSYDQATLHAEAGFSLTLYTPAL